MPKQNVILATNSVASQIGAAEAGLGVVVLSSIFCKSRRLVPVRIAPKLKSELPPPPASALWLVGHRALRDVPRITAVWKFIEEEAARLLCAKPVSK